MADDAGHALAEKTHPGGSCTFPCQGSALGGRPPPRIRLRELRAGRRAIVLPGQVLPRRSGLRDQHRLLRGSRGLPAGGGLRRLLHQHQGRPRQLRELRNGVQRRDAALREQGVRSLLSHRPHRLQRGLRRLRQGHPQLWFVWPRMRPASGLRVGRLRQRVQRAAWRLRRSLPQPSGRSAPLRWLRPRLPLDRAAVLSGSVRRQLPARARDVRQVVRGLRDRSVELRWLRQEVRPGSELPERRLPIAGKGLAVEACDSGATLARTHPMSRPRGRPAAAAGTPGNTRRQAPRVAPRAPRSVLFPYLCVPGRLASPGPFTSRVEVL